MDITYSSSFESEDDEVAQDEKGKSNFPKDYSTNVEENNTDLDMLCKGVNNLPLIRNTTPKMRLKSYWVLDKNPKYVNQQCDVQNFLENKMVKAQNGQKRIFLKPAFYTKREIFNGSASINRRKQLKQIEHDNMVNRLNLKFKKIRNLPPNLFAFLS
jgi:hypothetical protein